MSTKALVRALATLGVLLLVWGGLTLIRGSMSDSAQRLVLPKLTAADVDRVISVRGLDTVTLSHPDGAWLVDGFQADQEQIDQLFRALRDTDASSELIARNPASHGRLGVDSAGRTTAFVHGSDTLLTLVVGSAGPAFQTGYVRLAGSDEVFLYHGALPALLGRQQDAWRSRQIARVPEDSVGTILITRGGRSATLTRGEAGWAVGSAPADSGAVGRLLRGLGDLTAIGFATPARMDSLDFSRPDRRLRVLGRGGDTLLALDVDSAGDGYWARRPGAAEVFRLDFWRVDQLTPTDSALRRRTP